VGCSITSLRDSRLRWLRSTPRLYPPAPWVVETQSSWSKPEVTARGRCDVKVVWKVPSPNRSERQFYYEAAITRLVQMVERAFEDGYDRLLTQNLCLLPASRPRHPGEMLHSLTTGAMPCLHLHLSFGLIFRLPRHVSSTHLSPNLRRSSLSDCTPVHGFCD